MDAACGQRGRDHQERDNRPHEERVQDRPVEAGVEDTRYDAPAPSATTATDNRLYESAATFERQAPPPSGGRMVLPANRSQNTAESRRLETAKSQAAAAPAFKTNYTAPKPSTLIETPLTWDGASLLPGESRARRPESKQAPSFAEPQATAPAREHERQSQHEQHETPKQYETPELHEIRDQHEIQDQHQIQSGAFDRINEPLLPASASEENHAQAEEEVHQPTARQASAPGEIHKSELHEEVREFEPENASASHRVDTAAPSEFRFASVAEQEEINHEAPARGTPRSARP